jgi:hypothetical protein
MKTDARESCQEVQVTAKMHLAGFLPHRFVRILCPLQYRLDSSILSEGEVFPHLGVFCPPEAPPLLLQLADPTPGVAGINGP